MVFTGEAWGYLGSRRFLLELDQHSDAISGINHTLIETVIFLSCFSQTILLYFERVFKSVTTELALNCICQQKRMALELIGLLVIYYQMLSEQKIQSDGCLVSQFLLHV